MHKAGHRNADSDADSAHRDADSAHSDADNAHSDADSAHSDADSVHSGADNAHRVQPKLESLCSAQHSLIPLAVQVLLMRGGKHP